MLTTKQEEYLAKIADEGMAEEAEVASRNEEIVLQNKIQIARDAKMAELKAQADTLVNDGLQDFETNEVPKIK